MMRNLVTHANLIIVWGAALAIQGEASAQPITPKDGPLGMKFIALPKPTFFAGWTEFKKPVKTEIKEAFEIGVFPVTQGQWEAIMGNNPSRFSRTGYGKSDVKDVPDKDLQHFPVEHIKYNAALEFIKKLNEKEKEGGYLYRLPTEAEWEFACRCGSTTEQECSYYYYLDKPTNDLSSRDANIHGENPGGRAPKGKYLGRTSKVDAYPPNKIGLYDMHGNVRQMCQAEQGSKQWIARGGWGATGNSCNASARGIGDIDGNTYSHVGIRLVRVPR